jgi:hypothetical protein
VLELVQHLLARDDERVGAEGAGLVADRLHGAALRDLRDVRVQLAELVERAERRAVVEDLEADKKLKDRRKKAREQASPTPAPTSTPS